MAARKQKLAGGILKDIGDDKKAKTGKKAAPTAKPQSKHLPIPGVEVLGRGYNVVTEAYASADPPMPNLFDFSADGSVDQQFVDESLPQTRENIENAFTTLPVEAKLIYALPTNVQFTQLFEATLDFSKGESLSAEQSALSVNVGISGNYGLFAAEFSARYASSDSRLATHKFYSVTAMMRYYELSMANYALRPVELIRPAVRKDLNDSSIAAEDIFNRYGTHYLYAVTIGSEIVYGHTIDTSKTTSSYDAEADLKATYGDDEAGVGVTGGTTASGSSEQASDAEQITFYAKGVSDDQLKAVESADTKPLAILKQAWHDPELVDIPANGLKPIWNLCDDPKRRDDLQNAFDGYAKTKGSFVGTGANLIPLYLCHHPQHADCYGLAPNRNGRAIDGTTWTEATGDPEPQPWLYVFGTQQPGTIQLYEYVFEGQDQWRRYETPRWDSYITFYGWKKTSGNPVGWVYDGLEPAPATGSTDVYAYTSNDSPYLYSTDSAEGRDHGSWQPAPVITDAEDWAEWGFSNDPETFQDAAPTDPDAVAISKVTSNVHWRAPTL